MTSFPIYRILSNKVETNNKTISYEKNDKQTETLRN